MADAGKDAGAPLAKEPASFVMPVSSTMKAQVAAASVPPPDSSSPAPREYVIAPPRGTLAAGRWEAQPTTIWVLVAAGTLLLLFWALMRARRTQAEQRRKLESISTLKPRP